MNNTNLTELFQAISGRAAAACAPFTSEPIHYHVVPDGYSIRSLKDIQFPDGRLPARIIAHPTFQDVPSFCDYTNAFHDMRTLIFGDAVKNIVTAIIDYHIPSSPEFLSHTASLVLRLTANWEAWTASDNKDMSQADFIKLIETNLGDIQPLVREGRETVDQGRMLDVAYDLRVHSEADFSSTYDKKSHTTTLTAIDKSTAKSALPIPNEFLLRMPVFFGGPDIDVGARLRVRCHQNKPVITYSLDKRAGRQAEAFDEARGEIRNKTQLPVLLGAL